MVAEPLVLITGAGGALGTVLRHRLPELGWRVRGLELRPGSDDAPDTVVGSVADPDVMKAACEGVDSIVHLGGTSVPGHGWGTYLENNIHGTQTVLEAARLAGVRRVALASSNHAAGYVERRDRPLPADVVVRPDSFYGVSKAAIEALGSFYADEYGLKTTSIRIGSCFPEVTSWRMLSTWLSEDDFVRLVEAALRGPWHGHSTVWGISRNTRRWWSLEAGERIGYHPQDDAEAFATTLVEEPTDRVGGSSPPALVRG